MGRLILISKKLLSEVLGEKDYRIEMFDNTRKISIIRTIVVIPTTYGNSNINIYELQHLCKEWARKHGYNTHSVRNVKEYVVYLSGDRVEPSEDYRSSSEPDAVFQVCEWILEQKDKK